VVQAMHQARAAAVQGEQAVARFAAEKRSLYGEAMDTVAVLGPSEDIDMRALT
jgi:hypothetical protein